jgi:hypothetical protein
VPALVAGQSVIVRASPNTRCSIRFWRATWRRSLRASSNMAATKAGGEPEFFPLRAPETSDVLKVVERVAQAVPATLKRRGLEQGNGEAEDSDKLVCEDPWLAGVYAASVRGRIALVCPQNLYSALPSS